MKHPRRHDEETTYWLSYSDMMAGLLLTFVLMISFTMLHAKMDYDEKQMQLTGKEQELSVKAEELDKEREIVSKQAEQLNAQEEALAEQGEKIAIQEKTLKEQHELLNKLEALMSEQQQKLDDIIGVRAELVQALSQEFENSNLKVSVDDKTGAITFDASILFDYNKSTLKPTGEEFLSEFLPRYVDVLLSSKYRDNISEIIIEGHTDSAGAYLHNLELSQQRAYSVAAFILNDAETVLDDAAREELKSMITVNGCADRSPVHDENGQVDADKSRRVEMKFSLMDREMVDEMNRILNMESTEDS